VETLRELSVAYRRSDNRNGGGAARDRLVRTLHHEVTPLLRRGSYTAPVGQELVRLSAEMTHLAGWMAYDLGLHGLSQRYLVQSLGLARDIHDLVLEGEILAALAHQAAYLGLARDATLYAEAAGTAGRRSGQPHLVAEALVLEAHGHALEGAAPAAAGALTSAERAIDRLGTSSSPEYLDYLDEAYLSAKFGQVFRELRDCRSVVRFAERSLDMRPGYERGRVFNLALLAHGHALEGDFDEAARVGSQAADLTVDLLSHRAVSYIRDVARELKPHRGEARVAEFRKRARYLKVKR
jgi:hypothetical protein